MRFRFVLYMLSGMCASLAMAAPVCPTTMANGEAEWSVRCFEQKGDTRKVKPRYVGNLRVNRYGVTLILVSETRELLAVGRDGAIVIPDIQYAGDFDLPNADGIGRFQAAVRDGSGEPMRRCGFYDQTTYKIVVAPTYAHCGAFRDGTGFACVDCNRYCRESECHDSVYTDGRGFRFDRRGTVEASWRQGSPDDACDGPGSASVRHWSKNFGVLTCLRKKPGPFDRVP